MSDLNVTRIKGRTAGSAPNFPDGAVVTGITTSGSLKITDSTQSTSTTTGAVVISGGVGIAKSLHVGGNVSIGGTLTYEDVTNIDSVGLITARNGVNVIGGNVFIGQGGSGANNAELKLQAGAATGNDVVAFLNQAGTTRGNITYDTDHNFLMINVNQGERLRISSTGLVGISTATPVATLHVDGNQVINAVAMAANSVDCQKGNYFVKEISGATTFTFDNVPTQVYGFTLELKHTGGSGAITWPTPNVKWPADTPPTLTDGKTSLLMFITDDGGTRWRGSSLADYTN